MAVPAAAGPGPRDWLAAVPARPPPATVGDLVWAAFPVGDEVRIEPCHVRTVAPSGVTVEADDHTVHENVSGALVTKVADAQSLKIGDLVTYFDWRRDLGVAVVTKRDPYMRLNIKFRDSLRVVREEPIHVAQPLVGEIAPLAWIAFPRPASEPAALQRGLVFGADGDTLFVRDDANRAWAVPRSGAKLLPLSQRARKEGDAVRAFEYGTGYKAGTITKVFDPGYAYGVERDGEGATKSYYFSELVDAL